MTASTARKPLRTLVLNADYRPLSTSPLSVVSAEDAVTTVWRDRADVIEVWPGAFFRSPSVTIPVPKAMVLRDYVHVFADPKFCRRSVLLRDRYRCQYCGERFGAEELTFDHVLPRSAGGKTEWSNILMACVDCNTKKHSQLPNYSARKGSSMRPLKEPRQPTASELFRNGLEFLPEDLREDFQSFLYWNEELQA